MRIGRKTNYLKKEIEFVEKVLRTQAGRLPDSQIRKIDQLQKLRRLDSLFSRKKRS